MKMNNKICGGGVRLAVIIATKNRADAIERYALASLTKQDLQNFICVVWDASDDDTTQKIVKSCDWGFAVEYFRAPRVGSSSQRNDAINYILAQYTDVRFLVFMDDDCEFSQDALSGVLKTFETTGTDCVNMIRLRLPGTGDGGVQTKLRHMFGMKGQRITDFLYNYGGFEATLDSEPNWMGGGGMALKVDIFRDGHYFPEPFQRFGGYALDEDVAFSSFLHKKLGKRIVNAVSGYFFHHTAPSGRFQNITNIAAARWHNLHLLFYALYGDMRGLRKAWLTFKFKIFVTAAAMLRHHFGRRFDNFLAARRGIREGKAALKEFHQNSDISKLFQYGVGKGW